MKETNHFLLFWGSEFSQWFKSIFVEDGITFSSAEQYMMYHKALLFNDTEIAKEIMSISDVKKIKAFGRKVSGFNDKIWTENRETIVYNGTFLKFTQNQKLKTKLLSYPDKIFVEASPHDKIWGIGLHFNDVLALDKKTWKGLNLLGEAITKVRDDLV